MRLIDADALRRDIDGHFPFDKATQEKHDAFDIAKNRMLVIVSAQPTIEERKKGEWIKMSDADGIFYACSDCGEWHKEISNYCPNCGSFNGGKCNTKGV